MNYNPYIYNGALDPSVDKLVCAPRATAVKKVVNGIIKGDYYAILGPRQFGKTTLIHQIREVLPQNYKTLYFDLGLIPDTNEGFYRWLKAKFHDGLTLERLEDVESETKSYGGPHFEFIDFLKKACLKSSNVTKIVLFFDEIEGIPSIKDFTRVWRTIFHERCKKYNRNQLYKYSLVITGSTDLISKTDGPTSPYNIAKFYYLQELSNTESETLIDEPFDSLKFNIEKSAKSKLLSLVSGHPQLLQHACHILVDTAKEENKKITVKEIEKVLAKLFLENSNLDQLKVDISFENLSDLLKRILIDEQKIRYHSYKTFSIQGAGCIVGDNEGFCTIRNEIYRKLLKETFFPPQKQSPKIPKIFICNSPKDHEWMKLVKKQLAVLASQNILYTWDETEIDAGQTRFEIIKKNIKSTDLAIFLITADFLASKSITKNIITPFLERRKKNEVIIYPILVKPCYWEKVPWISKMQTLPRDKTTLSGIGEHQREALVVELLDEMWDSLRKKGFGV